MKPSQRCCHKIPDVSLTAYLLRAVTALAIMSACAYFMVKYFRKHNINLNGTNEAEVLTSLRLTGRDIFFVVRCGPDVIAFTVGQGGTCLLGRWNYDEWREAKHNS